MSYHALKLCKDRGDQYEADPGVFFPATIARIKECVANNLNPDELVRLGWEGPYRDPVAEQFLQEARTYSPDTWDLALEPYNEQAPNAVRARALAFAESWFKRALSIEHTRLKVKMQRKLLGGLLMVDYKGSEKKGVKIHIIKNLDWRR